MIKVNLDEVTHDISLNRYEPIIYVLNSVGSDWQFVSFFKMTTFAAMQDVLIIKF